jgi:AraC-like DNA-binding protein
MKELNVSKSQLHRKMTALTGNTASFYLRKRRLQEATRLLAQFQEMNIAQVAFAAGFSDANYFSTVFTTEFGVSPKNWRQEQGGN